MRKENFKIKKFFTSTLSGHEETFIEQQEGLLSEIQKVA